MNMERLREAYHGAVCERVLGYINGALNVADAETKSSVALAQEVLDRIGIPPCPDPPERHVAEFLFASLTRDYLAEAFGSLQHLRPGEWVLSVCGDPTVYDGYEHWTQLGEVLAQQPGVRARLGEYVAIPDILVGRRPVSDQEITQEASVLRGKVASLAPMRAANVVESKPILDAIVSCKWTVTNKGNRLQTPNWHGYVPHIVAVTAEPLPTRIAALALGTGDLDCVYHFALYELIESIGEIANEDQLDMLNTLIDGRRLRDISDLPFDLAI